MRCTRFLQENPDLSALMNCRMMHVSIYLTNSQACLTGSPKVKVYYRSVVVLVERTSFWWRSGENRSLNPGMKRGAMMDPKQWCRVVVKNCKLLLSAASRTAVRTYYVLNRKITSQLTTRCSWFYHRLLGELPDSCIPSVQTTQLQADACHTKLCTTVG
jgi:hypothetical protein